MKKKNVLVVAPHPDDETLGLGGTLLKMNKDYNLNLVQASSFNFGKGREKLQKKYEKLQKKIVKMYNFRNVYSLELKATKFDSYGKNQIISNLNNFIKLTNTNIVFFPWENDIHSDHRIISECTMACLKSFNNKNIKKALMYETPSETDFNFKKSFLPNFFVDISKQIKKKIKILKLYKSEVKTYPHPRSIKSVKALSQIRGSQSGFKNAESFHLVFEKDEI